MRDIFIGMLFIFLNFHITLGTMQIGLIPAFVGYYFMLKGLSELSDFSQRFITIKPFVIGMIIYSLFFYVVDLFGGSVNIDILLIMALALVHLAISLYISYSIIMGIKDIELAQQRELNSTQLYLIWKIQAVVLLITHAAFIVPVLAIAGVVIALVTTVIYLFAFNKAKNLFYEGGSQE